LIFNSLRQKTTRAKNRSICRPVPKLCRQYDCQWIARQGRPVENVNSTQASGGEGDFSLPPSSTIKNSHQAPLLRLYFLPINNEKVHTHIYIILYIMCIVWPPGRLKQTRDHLSQIYWCRLPRIIIYINSFFFLRDSLWSYLMWHNYFVICFFYRKETRHWHKSTPLILFAV